MPGPLRSGFVELMLTMHVSSHVKLKQVTGREFIVPLSVLENTNKQESLDFGVSENVDDLDDYDDGECDLDKIPSVSEHVSIRPALKTDPHLLM